MDDTKLIPMFKWSGGKRREIVHVRELMPSEFDALCEPFVGGGAIWFGLSHHKNIMADTNTDVINFYNIVKSHGKDFIDDLNSISKFYTDTMSELKVVMDANSEQPQDVSTKDWRKQKREEFKPLSDLYYSYRDGTHTSDYDIAKRFYVLRNLAFSGMLRYNKEGKFNVPYGYYKTFKQLAWNSDYENLFQNTSFKCQDWVDTVSQVGSEDFVFLDPPYTRKFTKYSADGDFIKKDHEELADWFVSKKAKAMIIINKDDFTEKLYKDFIRKEYPFSYGVRYRKERLSAADVATRHFVATNYE